MFFADFVIALRAKLKKGYYTTKAFLRNTTLQCYHYLADPGFHWTERIFWLICILLVSSYGILLMWRSVDAFQTNSINLTVDNLYLRWKSKLPAVIICDSKLMENHPLGIKNFFDPHTTFPEYDLTIFANDLVYYTSELSALEMCSTPGADFSLPEFSHCRLTESDVTRFVDLRLPCEDILVDCFYGGQRFNCCEYFQPMNTIYGKCYALNALSSNEPPKMNLTMKANDLPVLSLFRKLGQPTRLFVVSREENLAYRESANKEVTNIVVHNRIDVYIKFKNTENDKHIRNVPISIRQCRFPDENNLNMSITYSYPACIAEQIAKQQEETCGCTQYYLPIKADTRKFCTKLKEIICLIQNSKTFLEKSAIQGCKITCDESEVSLLGTIRTNDLNEFGELINKSEINIHFDPPRFRYYRRLMRDTIDLIVNVGGIGTLFFGGSIISIIEIAYYFFLYPCIPDENDEQFQRRWLKTPQTKDKHVSSYFNFKRNMHRVRHRKITIPFRN